MRAEIKQLLVLHPLNPDKPLDDISSQGECPDLALKLRDLVRRYGEQSEYIIQFVPLPDLV